ncbi:MAG: alpha/beta fold hydrolase [Pseudomonadota bacterium]
MDRRNLLKGGALGVSAAAFGQAPVASQTMGETAFVLVHGSWHGSWCWANVTPHLISAGHGVILLDLPGHGLNATFPSSYFQRPLDMATFAAEKSAMADIPLIDFTASVISGVRTAKAGGAERVIVVGHSMGGVPMTFAGEAAAEEIDALVYVSACMMPPGKPWGDYFEVSGQVDEKVGSIMIGDPAQTGCVRCDPLSDSPIYRSAIKAALAADVNDDVLSAALNMMIPDAPFSMYFETPNLTPERFGSVKRIFIKCTEDFTIRPTTQDLMIADLNAAFPQNPTHVYEIASSHEVMLSKPTDLSETMIDLAQRL